MSTTTPRPPTEPASTARPDWLPREQWPHPLRTIDVDGRSVAYTDVGTGPTLVLVHVGMWSFVWRDLIDCLAPTFRVVTFDGPGSGLSDRPERTGIAAAADALDGLVDHLELPRFVLVFHDLGGPASLEAAWRWPDRVAGLVALNSFGWRPSGLAFRSMLALMGCGPMRELDAMTRWLPAASSTRFGAGRHWDRPARRTYRRGMTGPGTRAFHRYLRSARHHDYTGIDRAVAGLADVPLLTIFGQRNDPLHFQSQWADRFTDIEQLEIPDGNHFPMCDDPTGVAANISSWYDRRIAAHRPDR